jgi:hypothetical protein
MRPQYVAVANGSKEMEMLALALELSITAPTDELSQECAAMAEDIACNLNDEQVEVCKAVVLEVLDQNDKPASTLH